MRLSAASIRTVTLRFAQPLRTASGDFRERRSVILTLQDADGVNGYGEAASWPGFGTESLARSVEVLRHATRLLRGAEVEPEASPAGLDALLADAPAARSALEGATWDLMARRGGQPLAARLAAALGPFRGPALAQVHASALLLQRDPDSLRDEAQRVREAGFRAAKLKLGAGTPAEDLARARAVRQGLGAAVALRGDANGAWDEPTARAALAALAECDFAYVEQPLPAADIDGMARLRRESPIRLAADESVSAGPGAIRIVEAGAADLLVLKPGAVGGPAAALGIAARAQRAGCGTVFTHAFESAVGAWHALHCAAAWGDPAEAHGLATAGLFEDDVAPAPAAEHGDIRLRRDPGIGVSP